VAEVERRQGRRRSRREEVEEGGGRGGRRSRREEVEEGGGRGGRDVEGGERGTKIIKKVQGRGEVQGLAVG
jgi:hypothetical protein